MRIIKRSVMLWQNSPGIIESEHVSVFYPAPYAAQ